MAQQIMNEQNLEGTNEPVRIAQVIGKLNAAGVEAVINNYYRNLDHSRFQFDYYIDADSAFAPPQELKDMGARYYVIPPYQHLFRYMGALIRHFRAEKYEIVHVNMNTLAVFALCAAWIAGVPVRINHNHSTAGRGELLRNIMKYSLRPFAKVFATDYCACSKASGMWLFGKRAVKKQQVTVFHNAICLSRFQYNAHIRQSVRLELGLADSFVVGHVGRFCVQKNHEFIIEIFREVSERRPDARLLLVGVGERMEEIRQRIAAAGLSEKVILLGARSDVERIYQAMDIFILPSLYEGLPVVAVEAQASGLPVICSDKMPKETLVLSGSRQVPLSESPAKWAEIILQTETGNRDAAISCLAGGEYDMQSQAKKMQDYYEARLKTSHFSDSML